MLGVSFATELGYTNLLTALDLAGIPLAAADRGADDPLVLAGGHAAFNPEPIAEFIDGAVLGDGEQAVLTITELIRELEAAGRPGGRDGLLLRAGHRGRRLRAAVLRRRLPAGRRPSAGSRRTGPACPAPVAKHTVMDLDSWPYPSKPLVPLAETVHERFSVEIFRGCTRGCRFCQAGMITRPVRERSITAIGEMVEPGWRRAASSEVGLLSLSSADHSEINEIATGLADRYEGTKTGLSLPSTRVDAFNVTLANELSRNGRRSGLTFAPEGGTERIRKVINKMVTEDDLIETVTTAYANGWRQVKLYFMCGLPTETDEDVLAIARVAQRVIQAGRAGHRAARHPLHGVHRRLRAQAAHPVPVGRAVRSRDRRRPAPRARPRAARRPLVRQGDRLPLPRRQAVGRRGTAVPRRPPGRRKVIRAAWQDGGRFDGWSEHFSYDRWERCAAEALAADGVDLAWYTTRERGYAEVLPWDHLDAGLDRDWLWQDWQDAIDPAGAAEVDDCRWTPCFDCGVCPSMGTEIQIGPTGVKLLPLTVAADAGTGRGA